MTTSFGVCCHPIIARNNDIFHIFCCLYNAIQDKYVEPALTIIVQQSFDFIPFNFSLVFALIVETNVRRRPPFGKMDPCNNVVHVQNGTHESIDRKRFPTAWGAMNRDHAPFFCHCVQYFEENLNIIAQIQNFLNSVNE